MTAVSAYDRTVALNRLGLTGGLGSFLGSSVIVGLSTTITMWQNGLGLGTVEVGALSSALNFAIAIGSIAAGKLCAKAGMTRVFNWTGLVSAIGFLLCVVAPNFAVLLIGLIIAGLGTGVDLPVSLSTLTRDAGDPAAGSKLVTLTQLGWQLGMLACAVFAFIVSPLSGATGGRIVFAILAIAALVLWAWRLRSGQFARLHAEGERAAALAGTGSVDSGDNGDNAAGGARTGTAKSGTFAVFRGEVGRRYAILFALIMVFYIFWNLLANTWAQFQTYMLVNANASQSLATGLGIVLYVVMFVANLIVSATINTRWRNPLFVVGGVLSLAAMILMAFGGGALAVTVVATGIMYMGLPLAGEAICKVWTQETFPESSRASLQGIILGLSRVICASFSFVAPALVLPGTIGVTLWCFVGVVAVFVVAGLAFIRVRAND